MRGLEPKSHSPIICICGMAGSGKSTLAKRLAAHYKLTYLSGGDALKAVAVELGYQPGGRDWWETQEGARFLQQRVEDPDFDKKVDEKLVEFAQRGDVVFDSWTMPWLLPSGFKVWLDVYPEVRAQRIALRDNIPSDTALTLLKERDEKTTHIYKTLYGFTLGEDFSPFHLILDSNALSADEVFAVICLAIDRLYLTPPETRR